jgi:hypothetical protein
VSKRFRAKLLAVAGMAVSALLACAPAEAADILDPTPFIEQKPAVDGINFKASAVSGVIGGYANHMFLASVSTPVPYFSQFGAQLDLGIGSYRSDYISSAAGLHIFWRNPDVGLFGIYGDWGYVNPEHAGRVGAEMSFYNGPWSLDVFVGPQFGQHVYTRVVDEVDLSYYFTENLKGSIGHRLTSRGNAANVGFEYMPALGSYNGWSVYGEAEAGEDNYSGAWLGLRYSFGTGNAGTLKERDRQADPIVRIPRNLASVTQCGKLPVPKPKNWWRSEMTALCASAEELASEGAPIAKQ